MTIEWDKFKASARHAAEKTERVLRKAQTFATVAASVAAKSGPVAKIGVGISVLHMASDLLKDSDPGKRGRQWHRVNLPSGAIGAFLYPLTDLVGDGWHYGRICDQEIAVHRGYVSKDWSYSAYAELDAEKVHNYVRTHTLDAMGTHGALTVRSGRFALVPTEHPQIVHNEHLESVWRRIAAPILMGHTRVLMLDGPPGTGKTTLAKALARRMVDSLPGATSLRIQVSDLGAMQPSALDELLDLLRVDVLLIDDLDRFEECGQLLDFFEHCHGRQRLVVVTVNNASKLPGALRRPGRIDEIVRVEGVGSELAREILGAEVSRLSEEQLRACAGWPAAFVAEVGLRLRTIPSADPAEEIADVGARARANAA